MPLDPTGPVDPDRILDHTFATVRRGVDPSEVERYLLQIAKQMRATATRVEELERELENYRRRPAVVDPIDPSNLTKLLGEETTRVLDAAHSAASEIRARAEESVARMLRDAREDAAKAREDAEVMLARRIEEGEADVAAIREQGEVERKQAEADAASIIDEAKQQGREMLAEAQQYRQRMLDDLARRRQALRDQIEHLQASRDRLAAAYDVVRDTLAVATSELQIALPDARFTAETAALRAAEAELEASITPIIADDVERASDSTEPMPDAGAEPSTPRLTVVPPVDEAEPSTVVAMTPAPAVVAEDVEPEVEPSSVPIPPAARRGSETVEGRHSSSVRVVRAGRAADVFARLRQEGAAEAGTTAERSSAPADEVADAPAGTATGPGPELETVTAGAGDASDGDAVDADRIAVDDQAFIATRDAAVSVIVNSLTRRVKRELSDEQNELLATVGTIKGNLSAIALLPTPESQLERYEDIALPALADAAESGAAVAPLTGRGSSRPSVGDLASDLASSIVGPLRGRLEQAVIDSAGDRDDLTKRIRSTYREWKGQRIDGAVEFSVLAACNRGILDRLPSSANVRWVVAEGDAPSPDCEDNALAGSVPRGAEFPTGHTTPPLRPGCHCAVLPVVD